MEILEKFSQRANFAVISKYKNYCKINEKWVYKSMDNFDSSLDFDDVFSEKAFNVSKDPTHISYILPEKSKIKKHFFYSDENSRFERLKLFFDPINNKNITTTDDDSEIKKTIGDPFASIETYTIERSVTVFEKKITLKYDIFIKRKKLNNIYFTKSFISYLLTINTETGVFYLSTNTKKGKVKTKKIRKNDFFGLKHNLMNIINISAPNFIRNNDDFRAKINKTFNNDEILEFFEEKLRKCLGETKSYIPSFSIKTQSLDKTHGIICEFFAAKRNIKLPNDYTYWLTCLYPTEKYLKKNERKLILASLDMIGLKNKFNNKIFHKYQNIDIFSYKRIVNLLGDDHTKYLGNVPDSIYDQGSLDDRKENANALYTLKYNDEQLLYNLKYKLNDVEKENMVKCLIDFRYPFTNSNISLIIDHLNMLDKINSYGIDVKFNSKTRKEFDLEHIELSKIMVAIKKGWVTLYVFNDEMVEDIEQPLTFEINPPNDMNDNLGAFDNTINLTFYPYILKREEEYNEEGTFMHHCVASYTDKAKSIIISVRNEDKSDRVTCEFNCQDGRLIQARHFCNKIPPADMMLAVDKLIDKAKKYARLGLLHALEHKKVPVIVNGVQIKINEPTRQDNFLDILV